MTQLGTITKVLVALQDLALGQGTVSQTRQGQLTNVDLLCLPFMFSSIEAIKAADPSKFPLVKLLSTTSTIEYAYDSNSVATADDDNVLLPTGGVGRWLKISSDSFGTLRVSTNWNAITKTGLYTNASTTSFTGYPEQYTPNMLCLHFKMSGADNEVGTYIQFAISGRRTYIRYTVDGGTNVWSPGNSALIATVDFTPFTLTASFTDTYVRFIEAATINVPQLPDMWIGSEVHIRNASSGDLTLVEGDGVTINLPTEGGLVVPQGGTITLKKITLTEYDLFGVTQAGGGGGPL